ncbi:hypothetical protein M0804_014329 [Polistes exclamans]|nr:hypothetical protein M0804_014330 [Polistes exclamans]KAI4475416.1 hypothetical protein M0804_014329 [Polistes exclamans]
MRGRGTTIVIGTRMSILRGQCCRKSSGCCVSISSTFERSKIGPIVTCVTDTKKTWCTLGFQGPWDNIWEKHNQGS